MTTTATTSSKWLTSESIAEIENILSALAQEPDNALALEMLSIVRACWGEAAAKEAAKEAAKSLPVEVKRTLAEMVKELDK